VHRPDGLRAAVAGEDQTALMRVPGIGRKGAQRLILELGDRLGPPSGPALTPAAAAPTPADVRRQQVVDALVGLGYPVKQAGDAVDVVLGDDDGPEGGGTGADADVAGALRAALRHLSGR
jgi:Holliday junction DNA helicase RuvA